MQAEGSALPMSEAQRQLLAWGQAQRTHRRAPALYVPRSCKQMAQQVCVRELRAAVDTLNANPEDIAARIQHLRTYALPQLLFRVPHDHRLQDPEDKDPECRPPDLAGHCLAQVIKDRIAKAWKGEWEELRREMEADESADAQRPFGLPPTNSQAAPGEQIPTRRLEAANRGKMGGMRATKDNLVGGPPVPPSPPTDAKIQARGQAKMDELIP